MFVHIVPISLIFYFSLMKKILLVSILFLSSIGSVFALDIDPITQTKLMLDQYAARVKFLESENSILREEMRKAGIQIPLSVYSGAIQTNTVSSPVTGDISVVTPSTGNTITGTLATTTTDISADEMIANIEKIHGAIYAGFVRRIVGEWTKVRDAYAMPVDAHIG